MVLVIDPKVNVINFGPYLELPNRQKIGSDEWVWGAARITYKDIGVISELLELKSSEENISNKIRSSLIKSAGAGHASMATTPGIWAMLEGNCSKLVDSMFTGARFGSFLMPSGRRVPINKDQIVVPRRIFDMGGDVLNIYLATSEANIRAYEILQERRVPKQEASKIVQYGHRGGGFVFMPLETIINLSIAFRDDSDAIPQEGLDIIAQFEEFIHEHGMGVVYEARKAAPRTGCVNPSIFHNRENLAQEMVDKNEQGILNSPVLLHLKDILSNERERRILKYIEERTHIFSDHDLIIGEWRRLLRNLDMIVHDYNSSVYALTATNTPWRVWGEVKRHRTLTQTVESVYHAAERARTVVESASLDYGDLESFEGVVSIPDSIKKNRDNLKLWLDRFSDSIRSYESLIELGIPISDAIAIVPRGLKLGIIKAYDLYNLTMGYMSLRLCTTAEPEMRATTEKESELIKKSNLSESVKQLIAPKCGYVGFCPDTRFCVKIKDFVSDYAKDFHSYMGGLIEEEIKRNL